MKRFALIFMLATGACSPAYLGDDHGRATATAFDAQRKSKADAPAPQTAEDTDRVLVRHRGQERGKETGTVMPLSSAAGGAPPAQPAHPPMPNQNPIRLEAK